MTDPANEADDAVTLWGTWWRAPIRVAPYRSAIFFAGR